MLKLLMNDSPNWNTKWFPTHVVGKDNEVFPIFIGTPETFVNGFVGLYVLDEHYDKIYHGHPYVILHDPLPKLEDINIKWSELPNRNEQEALHIFKKE